MSINAAWFRSQRTFRAAVAVHNAIDRFQSVAAVDRHIAVELALHDIAATIMERVGLSNDAKQLRYRMRSLEATEQTSRLELERRRERARLARQQRSQQPARGKRGRQRKADFTLPSTAVPDTGQALHDVAIGE